MLLLILVSNPDVAVQRPLQEDQCSGKRRGFLEAVALGSWCLCYRASPSLGGHCKTCRCTSCAFTTTLTWRMCLVPFFELGPCWNLVGHGRQGLEEIDLKLRSGSLVETFPCL
jgi:hypothetical protein